MNPPKLKPDETGRPRYMPASYIMRHDPNSRMAYEALRRRGHSPADAELAIEKTLYRCFVTMIAHEGDDWKNQDRRPEIWFLLAEELPAEKIFPDLDAKMR